MANDQQARDVILSWQQTVAAYSEKRQQDRAAYAIAGRYGPAVVDAVGNAIEDGVNTAATIGKAMLDNPGAVFELAGGLAMVFGGAGLDITGVGVSATGVGALVGVPATAAGIGMMATGAGMMADSARRLDAAARQNPVDMQVNMGRKSWGEQFKQNQKEFNEIYKEVKKNGNLTEQQKSALAHKWGEMNAKGDGTLGTDEASSLINRLLGG